MRGDDDELWQIRSREETPEESLARSALPAAPLRLAALAVTTRRARRCLPILANVEPIMCYQCVCPKCYQCVCPPPFFLSLRERAGVRGTSLGTRARDYSNQLTSPPLYGTS